MDRDDICIRAAKALRWELSDYHNTEHFYLIPEEHGKLLINPKYRNGGGRLLNAYPREMHFPTSYDWAMLGIAPALVKDEHWMIGKWAMFRIWEEIPSPEQITLAWVEILEKNNG